MIQRIALWTVAAAAAAGVGCAGETTAPAKPGETSWRLEGTRLIACCCAAPCS